MSTSDNGWCDVCGKPMHRGRHGVPVCRDCDEQ